MLKLSNKCCGTPAQTLQKTSTKFFKNLIKLSAWKIAPLFLKKGGVRGGIPPRPCPLPLSRLASLLRLFFFTSAPLSVSFPFRGSTGLLEAKKGILCSTRGISPRRVYWPLCYARSSGQGTLRSPALTSSHRSAWWPYDAGSGGISSAPAFAPDGGSAKRGGRPS